MSFSHVIRNDSHEFNLILMLLQPGMITSDSERSHTKKNQRVVILLIAKMGKAERTKAQSFHYCESKDLMEKELYGNLVPNNLLTGYQVITYICYHLIHFYIIFPYDM